MKAEILDRPELRVVMLRHVGPYGRIGETFGRLAQLAGPAGLLGPEGTCIGIFHDDPDTTPEEELRSEAAVVVGDGARVPAGLTEGRIPAGRYARTMHVGPYDGLKDAWSRFVGEWLPQSGLGAGDAVAYEVYCNDPQRTPPAELRTEMYLPIA